jgi:hypothetical protein
MEFSAETINELFVQKLDSKEGLDKVASQGSAFIRNKLREVSFARKIINPVYVTQADCQRSVAHDGLVKIVDIEPDSNAMVVNFRGKPDTNYVAGERFEVRFFGVSSEDFQKTEEELLAYEMPLTEVIEKNSVKDIQAIEDGQFMASVDSAVSTVGTDQHLNGAGSGLDAGGAIARDQFRQLFNVIDGAKLKSDVILMNNQTFNRVLNMEATNAGDQIGSELIINGYTYSTLFGKKLIVTNKSEYCANDAMYCFAAQEYLGKFFILNDTKFWIKKDKNIITWSAYETIGMGFGNTKGLAKVSGMTYSA